MFVEKSNPKDFFDYDSKYENERLMRESFPNIENPLKKNLLEFAEVIKNIF